MKKLALLLAFLIGMPGCSAFNKMFKQEETVEEIPLVIGEQEIMIDDNLERAITGGQLLEGMTKDLVLKVWGEPHNISTTRNGFIVWEYDNSKLYFLEDVLISWEKK